MACVVGQVCNITCPISAHTPPHPSGNVAFTLHSKTHMHQSVYLTPDSLSRSHSLTHTHTITAQYVSILIIPYFCSSFVVFCCCCCFFVCVHFWFAFFFFFTFLCIPCMTLFFVGFFFCVVGVFVFVIVNVRLSLIYIYGLLMSVVTFMLGLNKEWLRFVRKKISCLKNSLLWAEDDEKQTHCSISILLHKAL